MMKFLSLSRVVRSGSW